MHKWLILLTICLDWSLMWIDFTAVNVALAPIANDLGTTLSTLQWVITAYTLCSAAFMTIGGRLGDIYGHSRLFIIGTIIFVATSMLAGLSQSAAMLILSRVGQGIGIALVVPITTALVYLTFEQAQKGIALGFLTGTTGVSMAIGPTVGGILITYLNWRWVFFINLPIGLIAIILALILIPKHEKTETIPMDYKGAITLVIGLFLLLFALNKAADWGIFSFTFVSLMLVAFFILALFVYIETKTTQPLIHIDLMRNKSLISVIIIRMCAQYVFFVFMFIVSLYLENILNYSADTAGYLLLCATIVLGICSPFAGKLINHYSLRFLISMSCLILLFSLAALIYASAHYSLIFLFLSLILFGAAFALHFPITNYAVLHIVPANQAALVTGLLFTMAFAGASAGITISSTLLSHLSQQKLTHFIQSQSPQLSFTQQNLLQNAASGAQSIANLATSIPGLFIDYAEKSFIYAFNSVLTVCCALTLFGLVLAYLTLKNIVLRKKTAQEAIILE